VDHSSDLPDNLSLPCGPPLRVVFSKKFQGRSATESTQPKYLYIQSTKWKKLLSSFYSLDTTIFGVFLYAHLAHYSITDKQEGAISLF